MDPILKGIQYPIPMVDPTILMVNPIFKGTL